MSALQQLSGMSVLWPRMLWLAALLPPLIVAYVWIVHRQRRAHARLAGMSNPIASAAAAGALSRHGPPLLFFAGLCALIAAVSRPQAVVVLPSMQKNVILALDTSGSMRAIDVKPNRLSAAQAAARTFVENQPQQSRIGIVSIAGTVSVVQSLTDNREDLMRAIDRVQLQPGTAIGSGIYIALATLLPDAGIDVESLIEGRPARWWHKPAQEKKAVTPGSNRTVAIVLLSDGQNTHGPDPLQAAKLAAEHGVRIYTVGIGSTEGTTLGFKGWSMRVRLDEATLKQIAATTHGEYYAATSSQQLNTIYERLSARMVVERGRTVEVTAILVGVGALLLMISALYSVFRFNRVL